MILVQSFYLQMEATEKIELNIADMSSSVHLDNKGEDMLMFGEGPTQGLNDTTLIAQAKYPNNFTQLRKTGLSTL